MWVITVVQSTAAVDYIFLRPREIPAAANVAAIALILALPGIRYSQPGIPPIGTVTDIGSFFFVELIAIGTATLLLCGQFGQFRSVRRSTKNVHRNFVELIIMHLFMSDMTKRDVSIIIIHYPLLSLSDT